MLTPTKLRKVNVFKYLYLYAKMDKIRFHLIIVHKDVIWPTRLKQGNVQDRTILNEFTTQVCDQY